jgi:hypothetical protein
MNKKQRFQEYLQSDWQADRVDFDLEKEEAAHWLVEQERYTIEELHQQINKKKIKKRAKRPEESLLLLYETSFLR